ncbi:hypothetical protein DTO045G8_6386 [Paecilomyces variotii]|nr:hypothetical protein DTO045G8_6386 [Paecilomyces variotii]
MSAAQTNPSGRVNPFQDSRHLDLLHYIYKRPDIDEIRGNPSKVLAAIDEFDTKVKSLPNVGPQKGKYVTDVIAELKPEFMVELGSYVGYSAVLFADAVRRAGGKRYIGLEKSPEFAAVTNMIVELAGLRDFVTIIVGSSSKTLQKWATTGEMKQIPLLFLDHFKPLYTVDLKLCEHYGLVAPGSVLTADNVISPGAPQYLAYVRSSVEEKRKAAKEVEQKAQKEEFEFAGNPNLVYETKLLEATLHDGRSDGIEVSKAVREEKA